MKLTPAKRSRPYAQSARAQATEENGRRIAHAFFERLMKQWYDQITLDAVADDAGVTVQTIVRRFGGKEGLLGQAVERFAQQVNASRVAPAGDVDAVVESLFADYEKSGDMVMRLLALESRLAVIKRVTDRGRGEHRRWVSRAMAAQLDAVSSRARERVIDALVIATDVYTWKLLRRDMQRDITESKQIVKSLIRSAIELK